MRTCRVRSLPGGRYFLALLLPALALFQTSPAQVPKPTGAPLVLSNIETEQEIPIAYITPDTKAAKCVTIKLHWISKPDVGANEDSASFTIDLPDDNPAAPIFTAQLWNASLVSALAWQQPWQGARWKVIQTPVTDGTGIDAALAVGMIATSARRPYPPKTLVIGHLNPDGSLGPVSKMLERINAAEKAGMTRIIIPSVQRFDTDSSGQVINLVRHASDLHLECIPVDDLNTATETAMNDPLPDTAVLDNTIPKYSNSVGSYIDDFTRREQAEANAGLRFAPKLADLAGYPARQAATWKSIYADIESGQQAYRAGQVYMAYLLFTRANGRMTGVNALTGQNRTSFNVKTALAEADDLHDHLHILMNPPIIDRGGLESAVLVSEMADWAFEVNSLLEGAQLVTKQAFSQRSDATEAEKDRARESILFANAQSKYLLTQANFYTGLLRHIANESPLTVDSNAQHMLPQLIPAQLATARSFTEGIRASDMRDGLLFDPRLVAYVNILRQAKTDWEAHQRKKDSDDAAATTAAAAAAPKTPADGSAEPTKLNSNAAGAAVGFDPGDTYKPPHNVLDAAPNAKKLSNVARCLIWVNSNCEIATLDEKYIRLNGAIDPTTHEWKVKDRPRLDALLQMAEIGARQGIAFAEKTGIDPSVLAMIYERASNQRSQANDAAGLDALRNYWRCALLGNMCWQLAHTRKAQPVVADDKGDKGDKNDKTAKTDKKGDKSGEKKEVEIDEGAPKDNDMKTGDDSGTTVVKVTPQGAATTNVVQQPTPPPQPETPATNAEPRKPEPPVAPIANKDVLDAMVPAPTNAAPPKPEPPVAPIASKGDIDAAAAPPEAPKEVHATMPALPATNADAIVVGPALPTAPATNNTPTPTPPAVVNVTTPDEPNIPVARIAKPSDYTGEAPPPTNAAPIGPIPPSHKPPKANADGPSSFP